MHAITNSSLGRRTCAALSLIETMVAVGVSSLMLAAVVATTVFVARSFAGAGNYADLDRASRNALDILTRDIREAKALTHYSTNKLIFTASDNQPVTFHYDPKTAKLIRLKGLDRTELLRGCDFLQFNMYQRSPSNNFSFYPVQSNRVEMAKLIDVSWKCSRTIIGEKLNTESVQTAKIVMRN